MKYQPFDIIAHLCTVLNMGSTSFYTVCHDTDYFNQIISSILGAALTGAESHELQEVLEETNVSTVKPLM